MKKAAVVICLCFANLSLSAQQFELGSEPVTLNGQWQFYWQKFINPQNRESAESVQVPAGWQTYKTSHGQAYGYASFSCLITLTDKSPEHLILEIPEIGEAYTLYVNGKQAGNMGAPAKTAQGQKSKILSQQIGLQVDSGLKQLYLVFHVSNYNQRRGGFWQPPTIGATQTMQSRKELRLYIEAVIIGSFIFMALYHFTLFFGYRNETSALYFAIFVSILVFRSLLTGERVVPAALGLGDHYYLYQLEYLLTYGSVIAFILFFQSIFAKVLPRKQIWPALAVFGTLCLIVVATPMVFFQHTLIAFQVLISIIIVWFLILNIVAIKRQVAGAKSMLLGLVILAIAVVFDILLTMGLSSSIKLTPVGLLAFTFAQAYILKNRFSEALIQVHDLSKELQDTNDMYAHFVPHQFISTLKRNSIIDIQLKDNIKKQMTVLFCDIRGFTTLSESMTPEENFKFINSYLSRISPVIEKHGGFIDKFIGDAIMALFPDEPDNAISAAIEMQEALVAYNKHRQNQGYKPIAAGVGLHTGELMLGIIGNKGRWSSTIIADAVNLAARIESLTKKLGAKVATSAETFYLQNDPGDTVYRFLGRIRVKGKAERVPVFEILNAYGLDERPYYLTSKVYFERGINLLSEGKLEEAAEDFKKVKLMNDKDKVAHFYYAACQKKLSKLT